MYTVQERPDHLRIIARGRYTLEGAVNAFREALTLANHAGHDGVLVDARAITGPEPSLAERFQLGSFIAHTQAQLPQHVRFALLGRDPYLHPQRFAEVVATSRGGVVRGFADEDEALDWLLTPPRRHRHARGFPRTSHCDDHTNPGENDDDEA